MNNYNELKFDLSVLMGQSNAEGNGLGNEELIIELGNNVFELNDINPCYLEIENDCTNLICSKNINPYISKFEEKKGIDGLRRASFVSSFIKEYIDSGYLKDDRCILVIRCAVGGTGFSRNEWGINSPLYHRTTSLVDYALSLNNENKIVSILWHQGEHDAYEQASLNYQERYNFYKTGFYKQFYDFKNRYKLDDMILIGGEFCNSWTNTLYKEKSEAIYSATKDAIYELTMNEAIASSKGIKSNIEVDKSTNDDIHFSRIGAYELGRRYFKIYGRIMKHHKN